MFVQVQAVSETTCGTSIHVYDPGWSKCVQVHLPLQLMHTGYDACECAKQAVSVHFETGMSLLSCLPYVLM